MLINKIKTMMIGSAGAAAVEITDNFPVDEALKIVIQILIGISTLIKIFKDAKSDDNKNGKNDNSTINNRL